MSHPRTPADRPVIAIAGLGIESSTFSPARTRAPAFHPARGDEVLERYPFLAPGRELREGSGDSPWRPPPRSPPSAPSSVLPQAPTRARRP
ncbi:M81 family metallopeptidase, partial [Streptomyces sp. NPDC006992]|uniref:M81 family metallopeptidase n=1 Tax=Streptomyces sp. NPDC006992 TaxID=3155601 RepID=UPI0033CA0B7D